VFYLLDNGDCTNMNDCIYIMHLSVIEQISLLSALICLTYFTNLFESFGESQPSTFVFGYGWTKSIQLHIFAIVVCECDNNCKNTHWYNFNKSKIQSLGLQNHKCFSHAFLMLFSCSLSQKLHNASKIPSKFKFGSKYIDT
jgi:hypothetical protein